LAAWPTGSVGAEDLFAGLSANVWPYLLALVAAVAWGLYSNLARRWARDAEVGAASVFMVGTGLAMLVLRVVLRESSDWSAEIMWPLLLVAVGPGLLANVMWEAGIQRGNQTLLASAAHLTPVLSTALSCAILGVLPPASLWVACTLVMIGAWLCKWSIRDGRN
ncbi:MAG: EamA family transporter, partial [Planctomycetes bacterium]|nr:EamA family transporter [Planctomycetota bacterium]